MSTSSKKILTRLYSSVQLIFKGNSQKQPCLTHMMTRFRERLYLPKSSSVEMICKRVEFKGQVCNKHPVLELYYSGYINDRKRICKYGFDADADNKHSFKGSGVHLANNGIYASWSHLPVIVCHVPAYPRFIIDRFKSDIKCPKNVPDSDYIVFKPDLVIPVAVIEFNIKGSTGYLGWNHWGQHGPYTLLNPCYDERDIVSL